MPTVIRAAVLLQPAAWVLRDQRVAVQCREAAEGCGGILAVYRDSRKTYPSAGWVQKGIGSLANMLRKAIVCLGHFYAWPPRRGLVGDLLRGSVQRTVHRNRHEGNNLRWYRPYALPTSVLKPISSSPSKGVSGESNQLEN